MKTKSKSRVAFMLVAACMVAWFIFKPAKKVDTRDVLTGEIVVDFADDVSVEKIEELGKKYGVVFHPESSYSSVDKLYVGDYSGDDEDGVIADLADESVVEAVDKDEIYTIPENVLSADLENARADDVGETAGFPNDPLYKSKQWNMRQANVKDAWQGKAGEGVIVAVLDTGIDQSLEDLQQTKFVSGYNFIENNTDTTDRQSHGSHCSGTVAQSTNNGKGVVGVAYKATLMPVKVLSDQGSGSSAGIAQGIHFATDHGAKVISMSLGGGGFDAVFAKAVKYAHDKGVFVAAANGNSQQGRVSYPAAYPGVCAVAALQPNDKTAFYSNWGKETCIAAGGGAGSKNPDEGVWQNTIVKGQPGYYSFNGTSMATPLIAGVAALIISEGITNPDKVREILTKTARVPKGMNGDSKSFKDHYGAGIVNADAAVKMATGGGISNSIIVYIVVGLLALGVLVFLRRKDKSKRGM
jgi:serine protease